MKIKTGLIILVVALVVTVAGCEVIETNYNAGYRDGQAVKII